MNGKELLQKISDEMADEGKAIIQASMLLQFGFAKDGAEVLDAAIEKLAFLAKELKKVDYIVLRGNHE